MITPSQIRAARALLRWSQADLGAKANISVPAIANIELEKQQASSTTLEKIERAFVLAGIEIMNDGGVRPHKNSIVTYEGATGFALFRQDVLNAALSGKLEVCISNVDENEFNKWGAGKVNDDYRSEMAKIDTVSMRILVKEGDDNLVASNFAEYRWVKESEFGPIPFYIFGEKTTIISFSNNYFQAFIIDHAAITSFYKQQFDLIWKNAQPIKGTKDVN